MRRLSSSALCPRRPPVAVSRSEAGEDGFAEARRHANSFAAHGVSRCELAAAPVVEAPKPTAKVRAEARAGRCRVSAVRRRRESICRRSFQESRRRGWRSPKRTQRRRVRSRKPRTSRFSRISSETGEGGEEPRKHKSPPPNRRRPTAPDQTVDPAATKSSGWAVQLAAPRSEAEAKSEITSAQLQICCGSERVVDRRAQGDRKGRGGLSSAGRGSVEGRRGRVVRPPEGRRRRVLHRQVNWQVTGGDVRLARSTGAIMPKAFICGCAGLLLSPRGTVFSPHEQSVGPHPLQAQYRRP